MRQIKNILLSALIFFAVTMPFRQFFRVMEITEVRPASALPPVLGLMLGWPGALGCALGNFGADIVSGYGFVLSAVSFPVQFIYGFLPWVVWKYVKKRSGSGVPFFRLNNMRNVIWYIAVMVGNSIVMTFMLGVIFEAFSFSPFFSYATLMVFFNNLVFSLMLGIPIVIFMTLHNIKAINKKFSLNERLALIFLMTAVVVSSVVGIFTYMYMYQNTAEPLVMWINIYSYVTVAIFIMLVFALAALQYAEKKITIPLETLADMAQNFTVGEGAEGRSVVEKLSKIDNEAGTLAKAFYKMILRLDMQIDKLREVTAEQERISAELNVATNIQISMLPRNFPPFPNHTQFDIYAKMIPAKEVGGDFYDFFLIDKNTLAVVMADVAGKGVPAALFMVEAKTLIKNNAMLGKSPKETFETVNNILCENNSTGMFVTGILGYLDINSGIFSYVNAGHTPPLVKLGGKFEYLKFKPNFVLAGMEGTKYTQNTINLSVGNELFLYTDGITEAINNREELFGSKRLIDTINDCIDMPFHKISKHIKIQLDIFAEEAEQADDMAMLILQYRGGNSITLQAEIDNLPELLDFVESRLPTCPQKIKNKISLAIDEIFSNICIHANNADEVKINIYSGNEIKIIFQDNGHPFDPTKLKTPDITAEIDERQVGGLGVFLARKVMDKIEYKRVEGFNSLTMVKILPHQNPNSD